MASGQDLDQVLFYEVSNNQWFPLANMHNLLGGI